MIQLIMLVVSGMNAIGNEGLDLSESLVFATAIIAAFLLVVS
jgi:hypothetical protein